VRSPEGLKDAAKLAKAEALRQEQDMTSAQALAAAAEEGLELQTGGSGFVGVFQTSKTCKLPFAARVWRGRTSPRTSATSGRLRRPLSAMPARPRAGRRRGPSAQRHRLRR